MAASVEILEDGTVKTTLDATKYVRSLPTYGVWLRFLAARGHAVPATDYVVFDGDRRVKAYPDLKGARVLAQGLKGTVEVVPTLKVSEHSYGELLLDGRVGIPCLHCGALTCPICGTPGMTEADVCCESRNLSLNPEERAEAHAHLAQRKLSQVGRAAVRLSLRHVVSGMSQLHIGATVKMQQTDSPAPKELVVKQVPRPVSKSGLGCKVCQALNLQAMASMNQTNKEREVYNLEIANLIKADEDTVYAAAYSTALKRLSELEARGIAMTVLKQHQKAVSKELGTRGATKSLLTHPTILVQDALLAFGKEGEQA